MSLARQHRERMAGHSAETRAASRVTVSAAATASGNTPAGGPNSDDEMSLARRHRERMAGRMIASTEAANGVPNAADKPAGGDIPAGGAIHSGGTVAAQIRMRFQADMQRLHAIKSIKAKIEAKRKLLPEYAAFCQGQMEADARHDQIADDILATVMVWRIDTADYTGALEIAEQMLTHKLAMPARYQRDAATTVTEEIADAALRDLAEKKPFDIDILLMTEDMTAQADMPDEVRAKIHKAIGLELYRQAGADGEPDPTARLEQAAEALRKAQGFDGRCGVKKSIEQIERALRPPKAAKG